MGRLIGAVCVVALVLASAALAVARNETVRLLPQRGAGASGTAVVGASGDGTVVTFDLRGLAPGKPVVALLHAGTCARSSASVARIVAATANAKGRLHARGRIRYHGTPVRFGTIADGRHVITIISGKRIVACGVV